MIVWMRPSGTLIETNEKQETIKLAVSLGWELADKAKPESSDVKDHIDTIKEKDSKEDVISYLKDLGLSIDGRGGLEKVKEKAVDAINKM